MTKKHYIAIAEAIRKIAVQSEGESMESAEQRARIVQSLGSVFRADNPRFDWRKFEQACMR